MMLELLFAIVALFVQPTAAPASFTEYFPTGHAVTVDGFLGWEWLCDGPSGDGESCYAGWSDSDGFTTGP